MLLIAKSQKVKLKNALLLQPMAKKCSLGLFIHQILIQIKNILPYYIVKVCRNLRFLNSIRLDGILIDGCRRIYYCGAESSRFTGVWCGMERSDFKRLGGSADGRLHVGNR